MKGPKVSGKIQGNLKIMSLPDVLQWIGLAQKTGSLIFEQGPEKKVIFFRQGVIIGANSNHPKDKIGEVLIRMELLSPEDLEQGLQKQKKTSELIGDIFLSQGLLSTKEFVSALERQATEIIYDLFSWKEGDFLFQERLPRARTIPIAIQVDFILMEGMRRVDEWHRINEAFPTLDIILDWVDRSPDGVEAKELRTLICLIDGKNTILDICGQSPLNDFETCNFLYTLYQGRKVGKAGIRTSREVMEDDNPRRLVTRGKVFYQKRLFAEAIPFFERVLKLEPGHREAERFLTRSITAVQNDLLQSMGSPHAVLQIDERFRFDKARDLTAAEGFVLSRIDGKSTAKEVAYLSGLSQTEACITLNRLLEKGIIRAGPDKESMGYKKKPLMKRETLDPKWKTLELDLAETSLSEILLDCIKQRQTGVLQLLQAPMDLRVYFQSGAMIFAGSNMEADRCGSILLRRGKITNEQYEAVKSLAEEQNILQGNALVNLGILTPNDLIWLTKTQVEEILISLFGWRKGKARFFETGLAGFDIIQLRLNPGRIFLEGTWRYYEEAEILQVFPSWEVLCDRVESAPLTRQDLDLTETETAILEEVNGRQTIDAIAGKTRLQRLEILKVLFGFYSLGLVRICGTVDSDRKEEKGRTLQEMQERWEAIQKENYYRILDVDPDADNREIKKGFFRFSKRYHPDKCFRYADGEILDLMPKIFLAGKEAYEILSHPERRKEYDLFLLEHGENKSAADFQEHVKPKLEVGDILKADDHFNKAKGLLFSGRAGEALQLFEKALEGVPDDPDYNAYAGLALARLKKGYRESLDHIERALGVNPLNADYHAFLGEAHLRYGKERKALAAFREALSINPRHIQAKREVRRLTEKG